MDKWHRREQEVPEAIRVWLSKLLDLSDKEIRIQIATYLVEHNADLMIAYMRCNKFKGDGQP